VAISATRSPRKIACLAALAVGALVLTAACGGGAGAQAGNPDGGPLVIAGWGAYFTEATRKNLAEPFTAETGIEVQFVDAPGKYVANLQSQQRAGQMQWDLLDSTSGPDAYVLHDQGLLEPLPADLKTRLEGVLNEGAVTDFGFTWSNLGYVISCRREAVAACPHDMASYFNTDAYPGARQMVATSPHVNLSLAEIASGAVAPQDLATHEIDIDRAFATLEKLRPAIKVWWQSGDQMEQAFHNGEVDLGIAYSGRSFAVDEAGTPMEVVWDQGIYNPGFWSVVKGSQHTGAAFRFLEWIATHPEAEAGWVNDIGYSVPNPAAFEHVDEKRRVQLADWPANEERLARLNYGWYVKHYQEVNQRWQEFLRG
jgi:putative spermidine/putrescine transport system substrate-binding protein